MSDQMVIMVLGFVVTLIAVMTPIIKLNTTITKLNATMDSFQKQTKDNHKNLAERVTAHGKEIDELWKIVSKNEEKINRLKE